MPAKRIVACLDIDGGRVVKGRRFLDLRDAGEPAALAAAYCAQGIDEIVVLDVSATVDERLASLATIAAISRAVDVPLTAGGGVRTVDDVARLLDAGADKVSINSAAVTRPSILAEAAERFGSQCIVLAIDVRRVDKSYRVAVRGGREDVGIDACDWAIEGERRGAGELLVTAIDRDGTASGFDLEIIAATARAVRIPLIASGGAASAGSFVDAFDAGADAALAASIFHFESSTIEAVKAACATRFEVRV